MHTSYGPQSADMSLSCRTTHCGNAPHNVSAERQNYFPGTPALGLLHALRGVGR